MEEFEQREKQHIYEEAIAKNKWGDNFNIMDNDSIEDKGQRELGKAQNSAIEFIEQNSINTTTFLIVDFV